MNTKDFDFHLPPQLIAQHPLENRDESRMLCIDKDNGKWQHKQFRDILTLLSPGDCLVINDSKVLPARLFGVIENKASSIEILLLNELATEVGCTYSSQSCTWECLVKPGKKAKVGTKLVFGDGRLKAEILKVHEDGNRELRFTYNGVFLEILDSLGDMPLPPYITEKLEDKSRYQTVYANEAGSAAAPTAGLHFTNKLLDDIRGQGVKIAPITLHVGLGTFRPVKAERIQEHHMHSEWYCIPQKSAETIIETKNNGCKVIAVGTTCCRTLEAAADQLATAVGDISGWTDIFIYPGYDFKVIDGLLTNFHLPQSTLIMLVSAMLGRENTLAAYDEAVRNSYRFFSFGDCMLIS